MMFIHEDRKYECAAVLADGYGNVHLLDERGDYPPAILNLNGHTHAELLRTYVSTDSSVGDVLVVQHVLGFDEHPAGRVKLKPARCLSFCRPAPSGGGVRLMRGGDLVAELQPPEQGGWSSAGFKLPSDLLLAPESFFTNLVLAKSPSHPGPRLRLSSLCGRELAGTPC